MMLWLSKVGITISLGMVAHALFYPNKFSLIIAILGYMIALVSAVIYGLCKSNKTLPELTALSELTAISPSKSAYEFSTKDTIDLNPKMYRSPSSRLYVGPIIQALVKEKDIDGIDTLLAKGLDEPDIVKSSWIKRDEEDEYTKGDIPGYQ